MTTYTLSLVQGNSSTINVIASNSAGTPIILSGYNVRGQIRSSFSSTGILLDLSPTIYSAVSGIVQMNISGSLTASLPVGTFPYDLEAIVTGAGGSEISVTKFLKGYCEISPETTR
jgi:hypothetical protein